MREANVIMRDSEESLNMLVIDEASDTDWRLWRAFNRILSRQNDLALKVYALLLERQKRMLARDLATSLNAAVYSVRRVLNDLLELDLVAQDRVQRGNLVMYYWSANKAVLGIVRLIPPTYFQQYVDVVKHVQETHDGES